MNATQDMLVPDIGDFNEIPIIELLVKPGDLIALDTPIATLESDKATLDVPSSVAGRVAAIHVSRGSRVSKGTLLLSVTASEPGQEPVVRPAIEKADVVSVKSVERVGSSVALTAGRIYASPSVRRVGRDFGIDLAAVQGSGRGGRVLKQDVSEFIRNRMRQTSPPSTGGDGNPAVPSIDYSKYGPIAHEKLSRIRRISGTVLARNWATIPHVTNFDEADITDIESFRRTINHERPDTPRTTLLSFLAKACAITLKAMPSFNSALDGDTLILKKYVHVGVAVDTPGGLVVPVLRNVDALGVLEIASSLAAMSALARDGKLKTADMEGGCFTISSLGSIGGTGFTPIINAPELAILGVARAQMKPQWNGEKFIPRLLLPLCLSWDHRALDGVAAARFLRYLAALLEDFRRVSL